jgi:hypothetical protein
MFIHLLLEAEDTSSEPRLLFFQNVVVETDAEADAVSKASRWLARQGARLLQTDPEETYVVASDQIGYAKVDDEAVVAATGRIWVQGTRKEPNR